MKNTPNICKHSFLCTDSETLWTSSLESSSSLYPSVESLSVSEQSIARVSMGSSRSETIFLCLIAARELRGMTRSAGGQSRTEFMQSSCCPRGSCSPRAMWPPVPSPSPPSEPACTETDTGDLAATLGSGPFPPRQVQQYKPTVECASRWTKLNPFHLKNQRQTYYKGNGEHPTDT